MKVSNNRATWRTETCDLCGTSGLQVVATNNFSSVALEPHVCLNGAPSSPLSGLRLTEDYEHLSEAMDRPSILDKIVPTEFPMYFIRKVGSGKLVPSIALRR